MNNLEYIVIYNKTELEEAKQKLKEGYYNETK